MGIGHILLATFETETQFYYKKVFKETQHHPQQTHQRLY